MSKLIWALVLSMSLAYGCDSSSAKEQEGQKTYSFEELDVKPRFGGCDDVTDVVEQKSCADKKMAEFITKNLKFPESAKARGIEGKAIVSFIIEPNGSLSEITPTTSFGGGIEDEAVRVINLMNVQKQWWIPGMKDGKRQRVKLQLPINFKL